MEHSFKQEIISSFCQEATRAEACSTASSPDLKPGGDKTVELLHISTYSPSYTKKIEYHFNRILQ
ncbi:hypothetical protein DCAR_0727157 [Daucus carota subsp. sativus]|uniref:Uncharacterized protein n=1 Tax=Daucus carota subsp. sativus TaxID=79200 RepID=A0A164SRS7_DAUCS|nr:hypothetical protein DCAR_0727157 [Daucus carota subsp. sativus]